MTERARWADVGGASEVMRANVSAPGDAAGGEDARRRGGGTCGSDDLDFDDQRAAAGWKPRRDLAMHSAGEGQEDG